jgi:hypothetical protein
MIDPRDQSAMDPREVIDLLPPYLQDVSEDIYRSALPEWMKTTMNTHIVRAFSQFCMSVGEDKVNPDQTLFFHNLLWARQHGRFTFVSTDHMTKRIFLKQLQKTLLGSETDHAGALNSVLDTYGRIVLKVADIREYRL